MEKNGFTIIEMIAVIFFFSVALTGALIAIQETVAWTQASSQRLIAIYLVQEGIEVVKNIRDGNWLEQITNPAILWDDGLPAGEWEVDYNSQDLTDTYDSDFLKIDGGFYNYSTGTPTLFRRKIIISDAGVDRRGVEVIVKWTERGESRQVKTQGYLYNWRQ